jgi:hypothetical protein
MTLNDYNIKIFIYYIFTNKYYCIVYSPNKYRKTEGIKDLGTNFWNQGRTQEIAERYVHLDDHPIIESESDKN